MSGPVTNADTPPVAITDIPAPACVELSDSRDEQVGSIRVRAATAGLGAPRRPRARPDG